MADNDYQEVAENMPAPQENDGEKKFPALDDQQVLMAQFKIDELHKMAKTPYYKSFPWLCCCLSVCSKDEDQKIAEAEEKRIDLYEKMEKAKGGSRQDVKSARKLLKLYEAKMAADKEMDEDLANVGGDAFMLLGAGLMAYRKMLLSLCISFILMSLMMIPIIMSYKKGSGLENATGYTTMDTMTIANLGYSSIQCSQTQLINGQMSTKFSMQCAYGQIARIIPNGIGVNGLQYVKSVNKIPQISACLVNETTFGNQECSDQIDHTLVNYIFEKQCRGENSCFFDQESVKQMFADKPALLKNGKPNQCLKQSQLFIQYTCEITEKEKEDKYDILALVSVIVMFVSFLFSQLIFFLQQTSKLDAIKFDISTITASDFTVEYEISKSMFDDFLSNQYPLYQNQQEVINNRPTGNNYSIGLALKSYITQQVQLLLTDSLNATRQDLKEFERKHGRSKACALQEQDLNNLSDVKIVSLNFAYYNHTLIALLKARGAAITALRFEDGGFPKYAKSIATLDTELTALIKDDTKYQEIAQPVCAFITFESDDGKNEALSFCKQTLFDNKRKVSSHLAERMIMNQEPVFEQATEPSNIIWENRYIVGANYYARVTAITLISGFMLALAFLIIFTFKKSQIELAAKWPSIEVKNFEPPTISAVKLQEFAGLEFDTYQVNPGAPMQGFLEAFCKIEIKAHGILKVESKVYNWKSANNTMVDGKLCKTYIYETLETTVENNMIKYLIIIINFVIRTVVSLIMAYCGCDTESIKLQFVTNVVFVCQFFNTGVLPMLCTANLSGQLPAGLVKGLNLVGGDSDFNAQWFMNIGATITGAMQFNILMPVILEFVYFGMRTMFRVKDRLGLTNEGKTHCTTIQQYVNIYAGSLYLMQFKYSAIMTIVYITFMFGAGMPILFPMAAAAFFVLYLLETTSLHYIHQTPPAYDVELNDACLGKLQFAPLLILSFGYWMTTNPQLQQSYKEFIPLQQINSPFINGHYWTDYISPTCIVTAGPGGAMYGLFLFYFIYLVMRTPIRFIEKACDCKLNKIDLSNIEVDEDIPVYQQCLDKDDKSWTLREEDLLRSYGMQTLLDQEYQSIQNNQQKNKDQHLQGDHSYNILRNVLYVTAFQYVAANTPNRNDYIIDQDEDEKNNSSQSDLIALSLNACFLEKKELQALQFDSASCNRLREMANQKNTNNMA